MPHLTLHYSANLLGFDVDEVLVRCNKALFASGLFDESAIKSRAQRHEHFRIGVTSTPRAFIHVQVAVMPGRDLPTRESLAQRVVDVVRDSLLPSHPDLQITAEIRELQADAYAKAVLPATS